MKPTVRLPPVRLLSTQSLQLSRESKMPLSMMSVLQTISAASSLRPADLTQIGADDGSRTPHDASGSILAWQPKRSDPPYLRGWAFPVGQRRLDSLKGSLRAARSLVCAVCVIWITILL